MLSERVLLADGRVLELELAGPERFDLRLRSGDQILVRYWRVRSETRKRALGREGPYELRSVEQLRYDFEQDVADAPPAG